MKNATHEVCRPNDLGRCIIEEVGVRGNRQVADSDITSRIATAETSHLLGGIFKNIPVLELLDAASIEYERFDRFVLERDLQRIERYYQTRGFYEAHVRAGRVTRRSDGRVRVEIVVEEGTPVKIDRVDLEWKDWSLPLAKDVTKYVAEAKDELKIGNRFEEEEYERTKKVLLRAMTDRGFAYANVAGRSIVDLVRHEAQIVFTIELGPHCTFGDISLTGLGKLPEAPLRSSLGIKKGQEFSTSALDDAEIALADFGVFGAIDVSPALSPQGQPRSSIIPIVIEVQPAPLRAVKAGVGAEVGSIVEAHLVGGWENRNFLGGLRRIAIEARPGLIFHPWTLTDLFTSTPRLLPQVKTRLELSQPLPFDTRTNARLSGEFNIYSPPKGDNPETTYILGYRSYSGSFGFDRPFWKSRVRGGLFYNIEFDTPFSYNEISLPDGYQPILVPSLQTVGSFDLRQNADGRPDPIDPKKGIYFKTDLQFAGRFLGGDANDVRINPEVRGYVPIARGVTLAFRWATGFVLASNYPHEGVSSASDPETKKKENEVRCDGPNGIKQWEDSSTCSAKAIQLLELRGFFSGGANSNRGYGYRGVGPHKTISAEYLVPGTFDSTNGEVPLGGRTLWETSAELRFTIAGALGGALFVDASDVSFYGGDLRFTRPHLSSGFGLRYATPVGPARIDLGVRIPCAQVLGVCDPAQIQERYPEEGDPGTLLGLPLAVSIAIGEAF